MINYLISKISWQRIFTISLVSYLIVQLNTHALASQDGSRNNLSISSAFVTTVAQLTKNDDETHASRIPLEQSIRMGLGEGWLHRLILATLATLLLLIILFLQ